MKNKTNGYASPKVMKSIEKKCILGEDLMQRDGIWCIVADIAIMKERIKKIAKNDAEFLFLKNWTASCLLEISTSNGQLVNKDTK